MILREEGLFGCAFGAVSKEMDRGMHRLLRHTPEQIRYHKERDKGAYIRALASAGICLDMETDAQSVSFPYTYEPGSSRDICYFDVLTDGGVIAHEGGEGSASGEGFVCAELGKGEKRLAVWLPCLKGTWIGDVELGGASFARPHLHRSTLLTLGDSITQGYDALYPSHTYAALLARSLDARLFNQSIAGAVFDPDSLSPLPGEKPDIVLCMYGTNDWSGRKQDDFTHSMRAYIQKLADIYAGSDICVVTPLWRADADKRGATDCGTLRDVSNAIREECERYPGIRAIDGEALLPHDEGLFQDGYLHPNDLGFTILCENLRKLL